MTSCSHPAEQQVRTVYYVRCDACKEVLLVSYCNYPTECHAECAVAAACVQSARQNYHAQVPMKVPSNLQEVARARIESRSSAEQAAPARKAP